MFILVQLINMSVNIVELLQNLLFAILLAIFFLGWLTYTAQRQYTGNNRIIIIIIIIIIYQSDEINLRTHSY